MGVDIFGIDNMGVDILVIGNMGVDILEIDNVEVDILGMDNMGVDIPALPQQDKSLEHMADIMSSKMNGHLPSKLKRKIISVK